MNLTTKKKKILPLNQITKKIDLLSIDTEVLN